MLYSSEGVIGPPRTEFQGKRHAGPSCLASWFGTSSLAIIFFKKTEARKGSVLMVPKPVPVSPSMWFPGPRYLSSASRDHSICPPCPFSSSPVLFLLSFPRTSRSCSRPSSGSLPQVSIAFNRHAAHPGDNSLGG